MVKKFYGMIFLIASTTYAVKDVSWKIKYIEKNNQYIGKQKNSIMQRGREKLYTIYTSYNDGEYSGFIINWRVGSYRLLNSDVTRLYFKKFKQLYKKSKS